MADVVAAVLYWTFMAWLGGALVASVYFVWWVVRGSVLVLMDYVFEMVFFYEVGREMWHQGRIQPWVKRWFKMRSRDG